MKKKIHIKKNLREDSKKQHLNTVPKFDPS